MTEPMHADEIAIDAMLVGRLLAAQFPHWSALPLTQVRHTGTDNAMFRLGADMVVRLPRINWAAARVEHECTWLPKLAPHLPLTIQTPLVKGEAGEGYPWSWSICRWLDGRNATLDRIADPQQLAGDLATFIAALQRIDTAGGPRPGRRNAGRGVPLAMRDSYTRDTIAKSQGLVDIEAVTAAWEKDLNAPAHSDAPLWIHGDITPGNLLAVDGRLSAVIDFGCLGVGDPAVDLLVAWNLLSEDARETFRTALGVDDAMWARGRGWALSVALVALPYYETRSPPIAAASRNIIAAVLADHAKS